MTEPVSLALARAQCRIEADDTAEDALLSSYIGAARALVEDMTGLILVQRPVVEHFDGFVPRLGTPFLDDDQWRRPSPPQVYGQPQGRPLALRAWPIASVDGVAYTDPDGTQQVLAGTRLVGGAWPGALWPPADASWPSVREAEGVDVTLTAGFAGDAVPLQAVQAMLLLIAHWYQNREAVRAGDRAAAVEIPLAAQALCDMLSLQRV
jgi:uncharacterized phiE125 gp8 family phage protein